MKTKLKKEKKTTVANNESQSKQLAYFFFELGTLRKIARAHRQTLLTDDLSDNISSHSFRVAHIGFQLACLEKADPYKVLLMCLYHDVAEARSNDHNWIHKKYVKVFENEITEDQLQHLPASNHLKMIMDEYKKRESLEAKIAKDADIIDQTLLLKEYDWLGNKEAMLWIGGGTDHPYGLKNLFSESAKSIAKEIISQKPGDWWKKSWTDKNR